MTDADNRVLIYEVKEIRKKYSSGRMWKLFSGMLHFVLRILLKH